MLRLLRLRELFVISLILMMNFVLVPVAKGWDNETTHLKLSEAGLKQSELNSGYLNNRLGLKDGISQALHWDGGKKSTDQSIVSWIREGAFFEDSGSAINPFIFGNPRFNNHFHNPLSTYKFDQWVTAPPPYNYARLDDYILSTHQTGESALLWAQDGDYQMAFDSVDWSWQRTRTHFYYALVSQLKSVRDAEFAQTVVQHSV